MTILDGWKETTLGEVVRIRRGASPRPIQDFFSTQGLPWIKISDVSTLDSRFINKTDQFIKTEGSSSTVIVSKGDLILSNSATPGIPKFVNIKAGIHDGWLLLENTNIDKMFLYYLLVLLRPQLVQVADGAVFKNLKTDLVRAQVISIPENKDEQKAIAEVLSSFDNKIELLREQNKTLEAIAQTIFNEWFVRFNFPNENGKPYQASGGKMIDSELGPIPEGWSVGNLGEEFKVVMGQSPEGESYNEAKDGTIFFQGRTDFKDRFPEVRLYTTSPKRFAEKFDVLVSVRAPVGDINVASEKCCIGRGLCAVRSNLKSYSLYKIKTLQSVFNSFEAEGTVFGSINKDSMLEIKIVIPPEKLTLSFEEKINPIDRKIYNNYLQTQTLSTLRDDLLPKLMKGKLRVKPTAIKESKDGH